MESKKAKACCLDPINVVVKDFRRCELLSPAWTHTWHTKPGIQRWVTTRDNDHFMLQRLLSNLLRMYNAQDDFRLDITDVKLPMLL